MAEFERLRLKAYPPDPERDTAESLYWRKFKVRCQAPVREIDRIAHARASHHG